MKADNEKTDFEKIGEIQPLEREIFESSQFSKAADFPLNEDVKSSLKDKIADRLAKERRARLFTRSVWAAAAILAVVFSVSVSLMHPGSAAPEKAAEAEVALEAPANEFWQADSDLSLLETKLENIEYSLADKNGASGKIEGEIESIKQQLSSEQFWKG
ncbi:hypothetical protein [Sedimentisphaera salicampi]|uniref:Uncharacterized protein n=1 Tax=Sedimentisphaera salicampi TaxID=1941349 RepID=A0A1W6LLW6_9BACT|nr:hypothetical protein [Sedimentisphaera salicampi]ARN56751.1 hypothetical protein STSP1_01142 [Sedimentisphaera salicampi]